MQYFSIRTLLTGTDSGKTLTITAKGTFRKTVEKGAKVLLQVKYGLIKLINQEADLCDEIKNVDLQCPLESGPMTFTKEINLPREIPPVYSTPRAIDLGRYIR
jgi:ML domain